MLRNEVNYSSSPISRVLSTLQVKALATQLRRNARIMDELDVTIGFANLAAELRLVRPIIKDE